MRTLRLILLTACCWTAVAADAPRPSPPFTIERTTGPALNLRQYRGKVVALAFIQTTCPHCQALTTELNLIAHDYAARGVQFLECAFNPDATATMPGFLEHFKPSFPVGFSNQVAVMSYLQHSVLDPHPLYVPHMVFLDRAGVIRADYPGESDFFRNAGPNIRAELDKLLKAPAAHQ
uniref:Redoxin domain protein n=1 Tax=Solibacter usitatus (strain Ellin6076) TaxID=234267 RepID=Q01Z23_SOLUE